MREHRRGQRSAAWVVQLFQTQQARTQQGGVFRVMGDEQQGAACQTPGNAAGSLTTTKGGAIPAMPSMVEIQNCIASIPLM